MAARDVPGLQRLARLHGVQTVYIDGAGIRRRASTDALLAVLRALGAPVSGEDDVRDALRTREDELAREGIEPVHVAWDGVVPPVRLRRAGGAAPDGLACRLRLEDGGSRSYGVRVHARPAGRAGSARHPGVRWHLELHGPPAPPGYHRLELSAGAEHHEALLVSAPRRAYFPDGGVRDWGVFLPLYALRSHTGWGSGDLTALGGFAEWLDALGGRVVGTLPLLAAMLHTPFEPSPYAPASRLFWNELYADPARAPELAGCAAAREALDSAAMRAELERFRVEDLVDYRGLAAARRAVLELLARCFFDSGAADDRPFRRFLEERPELEAYARFLATGERRAEVWHVWPDRLRDGTLRPGDYDDDGCRYHLYVQWLLHRQLDGLARGLRDRGQRLYLDLPLGVHPDGFDVWHGKDLFARSVSAGAPPDAFFSRGQDWGFPPLSPAAMRATGFAYTVASIRNHLRYAGMLRIDHVMSLHRLFWVPRGMDAADGVYVRYPARELYAVLCLEAARHRSVIVGEDLGTVASQVRRAMDEHRLQRLWVLQFEAAADARPAISTPPRNAVAAVNTHDMPTFAAFWRGLDVVDRQEMGLLDHHGADLEHAHRARLRDAIVRLLRDEGWLEGDATGEADVLRACLARMAAGDTHFVLVNLEDLWGETRPQNVPGTGAERPNWQRKARYTFEEFRSLPAVAEALASLDRLRRHRQDRP